MIAAYFDVGWNYGGGTYTELNVIYGGLEKVVVKLQDGDGVVATAAADGRCIGAFSGARDASQSVNVGVDDGNRVGAVDDSNAVAYLTAIGGVYPVAVEDDVV